MKERRGKETEEEGRKKEGAWEERRVGKKKE